MQTTALSKSTESKDHLFTQQIFLPYPLDYVFEFFSNAKNLQALTPPSLHFQILTPLPIEMKPGALIDYKLKLFGIPFRWRTRIDTWDPPHQFSDSQIKGPYRKWVHTHTFETVEGGVLMKDQVQYLSPGGPLEPLINKLFVGPQVQKIFTYRNKALETLLAKKN